MSRSLSARIFALNGQFLKRTDIHMVCSSALVTAGFFLSASQAFAVDALTTPTGETVRGGEATFDRPVDGILNITQTSDRLWIDWDRFDIGEGATTEFIQNDSNAWAYNRVTGDHTDPTKILGSLKANGNIIVQDRNGVLFGKNSVIDVNGIVAATGDLDTHAFMLGGDTVSFDNMGDGRIELHGQINIAEAGLAAFVSPFVKNAGVINARLGRVAFAAGEKVTLDLYGDGLIEIEAPDELADALLENTGEIHAEGGTVQMTAMAAKDAVDHIINVEGIVSASSARVEGGKIILSGGKSGAVRVAGKVDASGKKGGSVAVKAQNIEVTQAAEIKSDGGKAVGQSGDAGDVTLFAENAIVFQGNISARGGAVQGNGGHAEVSGVNYIGYEGLTDISAVNGLAGTLLLDPTNVDIVVGTAGSIGASQVFDPTSINKNNTKIGWDTIETALGLGNVTITTTSARNAAGTIDILASHSYDSANNLNLYAHRNILLDNGVHVVNTGVGNMTLLAGWNGDLNAPDFANNAGTTSRIDLKNNSALQTGGDLNLMAEDLVRVRNNVSVSANNITVETDHVRLASDLLATGILSGNANTVNVENTNASINDAIALTKAGTGTVTVAAGTYNEDIILNKDVTLQGANAGISAKGGARVGETILNAGTTSNGVSITASRATLDGFTIMGGVNNVSVTNGVGVSVINNILTDASMAGILASRASGIIVQNNKITGAAGAKTGVSVKASPTSNVLTNLIDSFETSIVIDDSERTFARFNELTNIAKHGVSVIASDRAEVTANTIIAAGLNGIDINRGESVRVLNNTISDAGGSGIFVRSSRLATVSQNIISDSTKTAIDVRGSRDGVILSNTITRSKSHAIEVRGSRTANVAFNIIDASGEDAIVLNGSRDGRVHRNTIKNSTGHAVIVSGTSDAHVTDNVINHTTGDGIHADGANAIEIAENEINNAGLNAITAVNIGPAQIIDNMIGTLITSITKGHGIEVESSDGVDVLRNTLNGIDANAISISGSDSTTITHNEIDNVGAAGIHLNGGGLGDVSSNKIGLIGGKNNVKGNGVRLDGATNVTVSFNEIENTVSNGISMTNASHGAKVDENTISNIGAHGIHVFNSHDVSIGKNEITTAGLNGIYASSAPRIEIDQNTISDTQQNGIFIGNSDDAVLTANIINNAKGDGIYAGMAQNVRIESNQIGLLGGAKNINRHGIYIASSGASVVFDNEVKDAKQNGLYLATGSDGSSIELNEISNSGRDGLRVDANDMVAISNNTIKNSGRTGLIIKALLNSTILSNHIDGTGTLNGISAIGGDNLTFSINTVLNAELNGIDIDNVTVLTLQNNIIDKTGVNAINVSGSEAAQIINNNIGLLGGTNNIAGIGIAISTSDDVNIQSNVIADTRSHGFSILQSDDVTVVSNRLSFIGGDGVTINDSHDALLDQNIIRDTDGYGLLITNSKNATVSANNITNSGNAAIGAINGLRVRITGNTISNIENNGIYVDSSRAARVLTNVISQIDQNGVYLIDSENTRINQNTITNTGRASGTIGHGVSAIGADNIRINGNKINDTGIGVLSSGNGIYATTSHDATINNNKIGRDSGNVNGIGVHIIGSNDATMTKNRVKDTKGDGVFVDGGNHATLKQNNVTQAGGHGITVSANDGVDVINNTATRNDGHGLNIINIDGATLSKNTINRNDKAGLFIGGGSKNILAKSNTIDRNDIGIQLVDVQNSTLSKNDIADNETGIALSKAGNITIDKNDITENNAYGLHVMGDKNGLITVSANTFTDHPVAALFGSGLIDFTGNTNSIINTGLITTPVGFEFKASSALTSPRLIDNTLGETIFKGFTAAGSYYVKLGKNAFVDPASGKALTINGLQANYDDFVPEDVKGGVLEAVQLELFEEFFHDVDDEAGRGNIFVGRTPLLGVEDFFNRFPHFRGRLKSFRVTIRGLPKVMLRNRNIRAALNNASSMSSSDIASLLSNIAPAAGGEFTEDISQEQVTEFDLVQEELNAGCWGDAVGSMGSTTTVNFDFGSSLEASFQNGSSCHF